MAGFVELYIDQGTTFSNIITLTEDSTNTSINITGYIVRSQLRKSYYSTNISANLVCTVTDGANGKITMTLAAGNTANITDGRYRFDMETETPNGVVARVLEGFITINPGITR